MAVILLRILIWVGLPLLLLFLIIGPHRVWNGAKAAWAWLWASNTPEEILNRIVRQHHDHIAALRKSLERAEAVEADLALNLQEAEQNLAGLEKEAHALAARGDQLGAWAALHKMNLERLAAKNFGDQLGQQRTILAHSRRRLCLLELQLRQYEVGRSILLGQLAVARTAEEQYAIAGKFDPFNTIANYQEAEGMVQEQALNARAIEQVVADAVDLLLANQSSPPEPPALDAQIAELKQRLGRGEAGTEPSHPEARNNTSV